MILVEAGILFRQKKMKECSDLLTNALKTNASLTKLSIAQIHLSINNKKYAEAARMINQGKKRNEERMNNHRLPFGCGLNVFFVFCILLYCV